MGNTNTVPSNAGMGQETINTDAWVDRYGDILYRYAHYRTSDTAVAEDLVQDTFMAALKSSSGFAGKSSEQTWLLGILKHKILDYYRQKLNAFNTKVELSDDVDATFSEKGAWRQQTNQWSDLPDNELSRKEFAKTLQNCLSHLPEVQRDVFILREIDGFATDEICKDCNLTSTNLWVLLHRARKKLRDCLEINWFKAGAS